MMQHKLQPLRIPAGWTVSYNDGLYEIDPDAVTEDECYTILKEDLLQMKHARCNRLLDVGWYPSGNIKEGEYGLSVHEGDWNGTLLLEFRTRNRLELVAEIERLLQEISDGQL